MSVEGHRWSIVLAGGEGERLRAWTVSRLGEHRPKQYCSFAGGPTMLEDAWARASGVASPARVVTVIGPGHGRYLSSPRALTAPGRVLEQPANRDTGPGVLFPLTYVLAADPEAVVALFPSDHYVSPADRFLAHMARAFELAERFENRLTLLGAVPEGPETEYGWIRPDHELKGAVGAVRSVSRFHEKPGPAEAALYFREGYLWNTFILVAKARQLWSLAGELLPAQRARFEVLFKAIGTPYEPGVLEWVYQDLRPANFSSALLAAAAPRCLVLPLESVEWSDWGRPERIQKTLQRRGLDLESSFVTAGL